MKTIIQIFIVFNCFPLFAQVSAPQTKPQSVYFTPSLGVASVSDTFMRGQLKRSTVKTFHADLMFGNLSKRSVHFIAGGNFSMSGGKPSKTSDFGYESDSYTMVFQTEAGFRAYLNKNDLNTNPFFFKLSWIHGVNDNQTSHYNNEYNGLAFGFGLTKWLDDLKSSLFFSFEYQTNRQNRPSLDKNDYMNLDLFQFNLGLTL